MDTPQHREEPPGSLERFLGRLRIAGALLLAVFAVADRAAHPTVVLVFEMAALATLAAAGLATLVVQRRAADAADRDAALRASRAAHTADLVILLGLVPLHGFDASLGGVAPALLVPVLGGARGGTRGAGRATGLLVAAIAARGLVALEVWHVPAGPGRALAAAVVAGVAGLVAGHLADDTSERLLAARRQADDAADAAADARRVATDAAAARTELELLHDVLAAGVGGSTVAVVERTSRLLRQAFGADARLTLDPAGSGAIPRSRDGCRHVPVTAGDEHLAVLALPESQDVLGTASLARLTAQIGLVLQAAIALDAKVQVAARYRELDRLKTDFVAITSHELRTPITAIRGATETLRTHGPVLSAHQRSELLDAVGRQTERLVRLVDDLVTISHADAGTLDVRPVPLPLRTVVDDAVRATGRETDVRLLATPRLHVHADPVRLQQVLSNVLENAFEHGAPPVHVSWRQVGDQAQIRVRDHGDGVPPEARERIFLRFSQGVDPRHHSRGSGLGLAVARDLARAMGGDLVVDPSTDDGTAFLVTVRLARRPVPAEVVART